VSAAYSRQSTFLALALWAYGLAFRDADPVGALNALGRGLVIAQYSGNRTGVSVVAPPLARLEAEHGGTVSAFDHLTLAIRPFSAAGVPEITTAIAHLRDVLGEATYESLARKGETMTTSAMVMYAYDQIEQARTELEHPS
jgi:hypothetical protein